MTILDSSIPQIIENETENGNDFIRPPNFREYCSTDSKSNIVNNIVAY